METTISAPNQELNLNFLIFEAFLLKTFFVQPFLLEHTFLRGDKFFLHAGSFSLLFMKAGTLSLLMKHKHLVHNVFIYRRDMF